ncbi:hypothetical protein RB601_001398 [Gaeumannomyces tritici]
MPLETTQSINLVATRPVNPLPKHLNTCAMDSQSKESRVILALPAIENDPKISMRAAAKLYNIPYSTLNDRRHGRIVRSDSMSNSRKLIESEEEALVKYILELDSRAFPPRPSGVEDMANRLLAERDTGTVGTN